MDTFKCRRNKPEWEPEQQDDGEELRDPCLLIKFELFLEGQLVAPLALASQATL